MTNTEQLPNTNRHWCQISLKWLMIGVTVFTVTVGWVGGRMRQARENRARVAAVEEAVAWVEELDGHVSSEYKTFRPQTWMERQFSDPGGVNNPVGALITVQVELSGNKVDDAGLEQHLKKLKDVRDLGLRGTNITDNGLKHLKGLTELETLSLGDTKVSDRGLEHLKGLANLEVLGLRNTNVNDAGLEHLKGLTKLIVLTIRAREVTDVGLGLCQD